MCIQIILEWWLEVQKLVHIHVRMKCWHPRSSRSIPCVPVLAIFPGGEEGGACHTDGEDSKLSRLVQWESSETKCHLVSECPVLFPLLSGLHWGQWGHHSVLNHRDQSWIGKRQHQISVYSVLLGSSREL